MMNESKLVKTLNAVIERHGEGRTDWAGAVAHDDSWSLWSLPIVVDLLEFLRPYFILLVSEDRIVINKISFQDKILSSQTVSRAELKSFAFKKGILSTKAQMTLPDSKTYKFSFMPTKLFLSYADTQRKALELLEGYSK